MILARLSVRIIKVVLEASCIYPTVFANCVHIYGLGFLWHNQTISHRIPQLIIFLIFSSPTSAGCFYHDCNEELHEMLNINDKKSRNLEEGRDLHVMFNIFTRSLFKI